MELKRLWLIILCIVVPACFTTWSLSARQKSLAVVTIDGAKTNYKLKSNPEVTFDGNNLIVESDGERIEYPLTKVDKIFYEEEVNPPIITGVETPDMDSSKPYVENGRFLIISGLANDTNVEVFGTDGRLYMSFKVEAQSVQRISLGHLSSGVYLVKINNTTHKLLVK